MMNQMAKQMQIVIYQGPFKFAIELQTRWHIMRNVSLRYSVLEISTIFGDAI